MALPNNSNYSRAKVGLPLKSSSRRDSLTQIRLRLGIPKTYYQEPVISRLTADYQLLVNITGAMLSPATQDRGWFDLEIQGTAKQIQSGLAYLQQLELEICGRPNPDGDGWHY